jgi:hypothetical protein
VLHRKPHAQAKRVRRVGFEPTKLTHWILSPTPLTTRVPTQYQNSEESSTTKFHGFTVTADQ